MADRTQAAVGGIRPFLYVAAASFHLLLSATAWLPSAAAEDVATSFEFNDLDGSFTLGTSPNSLQFTGGEARTVGNPSLYRTGSNAWMIPAGQTGAVLFESPTRAVSLWFRDASSSVDSVITVFDEEDAALATFGGSTAFQQIDLQVAGPSRIHRMEVVHNGASGHVVVDDFTSCTHVAPIPLDNPLPAPIPLGSLTVGLEPAAEGLTAPNWGTTAPGHPGRLFVSDQVGILWSIELVSGDRAVFLDATKRLVNLGIAGPGTFDERGLLGVAFHPGYAENGRLYTYTSEPVDGEADFSTLGDAEVADHQSVLLEWTVNAPLDPASVVDPTSARELLRIDQPQFNHDGGGLAFGPDGMLYVSLGDGGSADDEGPGHLPGGNGQDPGNILGSILRIDVLGTNSANGRYGVPVDNPFVGTPGRIAEIWAYGFRNPFRISFDSQSGQLMAADVGQNDIEEIDVVLAGGNYGWPRMEGSFFFDGNGEDDGFVTADDPGNTDDLLRPLAEYDHDEGLAVIGGFVYRGSAIPELAGSYVFGDFARTFDNDGRLFRLDSGSTVVEFDLAGRDGLGASLLGFGQDATGELYVLTSSTGTPFGSTGKVWRIVRADPVATCGDADDNGQVLASDALRTLRSAVGSAACEPCACDVNASGSITAADALQILQFSVGIALALECPPCP
ncbi:MAG: PQQ-dependent sugar dehydrogenase [Candidatus Binatia bacterium]